MAPPRTREPQRIAKLLARAGVASRREIERMIAEGRIALNGTVLDTPATLLPSLHGVTVDGNPVAAPAPTRLFRFHKPTGLLTTERDPAGRRTIYDRLPQDLPRVVPVGRLDLNTEGLLLLTTDGELKRELELPATGIARTYRARAYGQVSQAQLEELIEGVTIEGVRYGSIDANLERRTGANVWIEMTITEGKNREVRRVLEYLGLRVSRLIRTRYGPFHLADLPEGEVEEVRQHDLVAFRKALAGGGGKAASNLQIAVRPRAIAPKPEPAPEAKPEPANRAERRKAAAKASAPAPARPTRPEKKPARKAGAPARPVREGRDEGAAAKPARRTPRAAPARADAPRPDKPERKGDVGTLVTREAKDEADRATFADRPKRRYRPTDRRPRKPSPKRPGPRA